MPQAMTRPYIPDMKPNIEPQQAFRGFTNVPGYAFPDNEGQAITTNYVPEDYGTNPNAQLVGGQDPGVAPELPPEEYAKFEKRTQQETPISSNDIARMNPKEAAAAIEKQLGPRPTLADTKPALYKQAMVKFNDHYIATENRQPSAKAWALFDEQWGKDPKVASTVKQMQAEYDDQYTKLENQANDTREQNKVMAGKRKDAREWIRDIVDQVTPDKKQNAMHEATKELARIMSNTDLSTIDNNLDNLRDDMRSRYGLQKVKEDKVTGKLTEATILEEFDNFAYTLPSGEPSVIRKNMHNRYLELKDQGLSREQAYNQVINEFAQTGGTQQTDGSFNYLWGGK